MSTTVLHSRAAPSLEYLPSSKSRLEILPLLDASKWLKGRRMSKRLPSLALPLTMSVKRSMTRVKETERRRLLEVFLLALLDELLDELLEVPVN